MKRIAIAAAVAAAALAQPAAAQKWTGFHVAVGGGAVDTDHAASVTAAVVGFDDPIYAGRPFPTGLINLPNLVTYLDADADGRGKVNDTEAFTSIQVGYDYRLNRNFVLGGFASMDTGPQQSDTIKGSGSWQLVEAGGALPVPGFRVAARGTSTVTASVSTRHALALGSRVGYLVHRETMLYVLGGYTATRADLQFAIDVPQLSLASRYTAMRDSDWRDGYVVGGGLEAKLNKEVSLKLEYRHSNFGSYGFSAEENFVLPIGPANPYRLEGDVIGGVQASALKSNAVRLLLAFRL